MLPKKNLTKKVFFIKKTSVFAANNSLVIQCKENNGLLKFREKCPYLFHEK